MVTGYSLPLLALEQPLYIFNKSNSAYYHIKFPLLQLLYHVWNNSQKCCICNPKWAGDPHSASLYHAELWENTIVLRCVTSSICVYPKQVHPGRANWKLFAANWKSNRQYQCRPYWDNCYIGAWYMKNAMDALSAQGERRSWLESPLWGGALRSTSPDTPTCGKHPIVTETLHFSPIIVVCPRAEKPRFIYIWLWKSFNEFLSKLTLVFF